MAKNLSIPAGPRSPVNLKWLYSTGPYAAIIQAYRTILRPNMRSSWNNGVPTSHEAMAAVLAPGGGRKAFVRYTTPQLSTKKQYGFVLSWILLLVSVVVPGLRIDTGQSWAN